MRMRSPTAPLPKRPSATATTPERWLVAQSGPDTVLTASGAGGAVADAVAQVLTAADAHQHRRVTTVDLVPAGVRGHPRAVLVLPRGRLGGRWVPGRVDPRDHRGGRPANPRRSVIRLGALAVYAVASGLGGALIAGPVLGALDRPLLEPCRLRCAAGLRRRRLHDGDPGRVRSDRHRDRGAAVRDPGQPERRRRLPVVADPTVLAGDRAVAAAGRGHLGGARHRRTSTGRRCCNRCW